MKPGDIIELSRPWFWLYLAGPFLVGFGAAATSLAAFLTWEFWAGLAYFLIPANIFLYGVNDIFDRDTDAHNPKKGSEERAFQDDDLAPTIRIVSLAGLLGLAYAAFVSWRASASMLGFLALSYLYSGWPSRLKATPILDSVSNVLYVLPGVLGYTVLAQSWPDVVVVIAASLWSMAMHLYSAVPDIDADRSAGLTTTATALGETGSLAACTALWAVSAAAFTWVDAVLSLAWAYPVLALFAFWHRRIDAQYWWYPYLNGVVGMAGFWYAVWPIL